MIYGKKDPQETHFYTAHCGHEIYDCENSYIIGNKTYCQECAEDYIRDLPLRRMIEAIGGEVIEPADIPREEGWIQ